MCAGRVPGWPGASTKVAAVIGEPVEHSLSPVLHNAAFAALELDWIYVALPVAAGDVFRAMAGVRALGVAGLSVTMPHKAAAAGAMDQLSATAARLGAVNTVTRRGSQLVGDSTDGDGFVSALRNDEGWDPAGRRCVVLGAGGAARAVILALAEAGAATVSVVARRPEAAAGAAVLAGGVGEVASVDTVAGADLIVNATPVGMIGPIGLGHLPSGAGHDPRGMTGPPGGDVSPEAAALPLGVDATRLGSGQMVVDLIYAPPTTALLVAARAAGATAANGLGTLINQAGLQFRLWTGMDPPLGVMSAAAVAALAALAALTARGHAASPR